MCHHFFYNYFDHNYFSQFHREWFLYEQSLTKNILFFYENFSIKISENGKTAILQLACGDLRRVLNLLQSSHMSYPEITEEVINDGKRISFYRGKKELLIWTHCLRYIICVCYSYRWSNRQAELTESIAFTPLQLNISILFTSILFFSLHYSFPSVFSSSLVFLLLPNVLFSASFISRLSTWRQVQRCLLL